MRFSALLALAAMTMFGYSLSAAQVAHPQLFTPPNGWGSVPGDSLMAGMQSVWQGQLPFNASQFSMLGMWLGGSPMQMITLARGHAVVSPDAIIRQFPAVDESKGQAHYQVSTEHTTFCGYPGALLNVQFGGVMGFTMAYDAAVTSANGTSYMLSYIHMANDSDPSAQRALRSLCPTGAIPRIQSSATN